jgi:hypothetical protein
MKILLIHILLLANLSSGVAFAWDTHPEAIAGHDEVVLELLGGDDHSHPDGDLHHNDHCCHGAAHMMCLFNGVTSDNITVSQDYNLYLASAIPLLYTSQLLRPPTV